MKPQRESSPPIIHKESQESFTIPIEGSLGLLALGSVGLKAWRQKKQEYIQTLQSSTERK